MLYEHHFIEPYETPEKQETQEQRYYTGTDKRDLYLTPRDYILPENKHKVNPIVDDDGNRKQLNLGVIQKEQRRVLSINSNQRTYYYADSLNNHNPSEFIGYINPNNYEHFEELYNIALGQTSTIQTYEDYIKTHNVTLTQVLGSDAAVRSTIKNLLQATVGLSSNIIASVNDTLLDILSNIITTNQGLVSQGTIANQLNIMLMTAPAHNPAAYWRPFRYNNTGINYVNYRDQHPSSYTVTLPHIVRNVKSIRLLSTEIPNTVNNITERNNILILKVRYKSTALPVVIRPDRSAFSFVMVQLDVGMYDLTGLLCHMEDKLNKTLAYMTGKNIDGLFRVTCNKSTGVVSINCNNNDLEFHLKFYCELTDQINIPNPGIPSQSLGKSPGTTSMYAHELWYMLGFPWPYDVDDKGSDLYTTSRSNVVNFGLHAVFSEPPNEDIFQRDKPQSSTVTSNTLNVVLANKSYLALPQYAELTIKRPYRYPDITHRYIYLVMKGFKSMSHVNQRNNVIGFTDNDIFAKILLNVPAGTIAYNSFVSNPLIFPNALDKIETLEIQWVDETGVSVDFNDADHSLTLEIIQYVTQVETTGYNTALGNIDTKSYPELFVGSAK